MGGLYFPYVILYTGSYPNISSRTRDSKICIQKLYIFGYYEIIIFVRFIVCAIIGVKDIWFLVMGF
jgi:hypothetical protein